MRRVCDADIVVFEGVRLTIMPESLLTLAVTVALNNRYIEMIAISPVQLVAKSVITSHFSFQD